MTSVKAEQQLELNVAKHAAEFRRKHKVPQAQWDLGEAMTEDLQSKLLREFWEVYDREGNDGRRGGKAFPGPGMENEMRAAN